MKKIIIVLVVLFSQVVFGQNVNETFTNANALYKDGKFTEAINAYESILNEGQVSPDLYFNLANAYYKINKVAPAIYNYEKALQLNPLHEDAKNNLVFAKRLTLDRIEALPKSLLQRLNENVLQKLSYNTWAMLSILFSVLASLLFVLFYFADESSKKRLYFTTSIFSFIALMFVLIISFTQYAQATNKIEAIIYPEKVEIKNAPTSNSDEVFTLHEGTKVRVLDEVDNWLKIKLADGKIGWILKEQLKVL